MNEPFVPEGAPRRLTSRIWNQFLGHNLGAFLILSCLAKFVGLEAAVVIYVAVFLLTCREFASSRKIYNRIGWYELKPIEVSFPFEVKVESGVHTFEEDSIILHSGKFTRMKRKVISYDSVKRVETSCRGIYFRGVNIHLNDHKPVFISNEGENGEPARTTLAILCLKAPYAQFDGPQWVADGWVPRFGFGYPSSD